MATFIDKWNLVKYIAFRTDRTLPEVVVAIAIINYTNERRGGKAWPSVDHLVKLTRFGRRTVQYALSGLVRGGILIKDPGGRGAGSTNSYQISSKALSLANPPPNPNKGAQPCALNPNKGAQPCALNPNKGAQPCAQSYLLATQSRRDSAYARTARSGVSLRDVEPRKKEKKEVVATRADNPLVKAHKGCFLVKEGEVPIKQLDKELNIFLEDYRDLYDDARRYQPREDRGRIWGAYIYARKKASARVILAGLDDYATTLSLDGIASGCAKHAANWLHGECWLPEDARPVHTIVYRKQAQ